MNNITINYKETPTFVMEDESFFCNHEQGLRVVREELDNGHVVYLVECPFDCGDISDPQWDEAVREYHYFGDGHEN